jgi:hypothetical protein
MPSWRVQQQLYLSSVADDLVFRDMTPQTGNVHRRLGAACLLPPILPENASTTLNMDAARSI